MHLPIDPFVMSFSFFFFQAEDGIRDHCVTGVQTCALPISVGWWSAAIPITSPYAQQGDGFRKGSTHPTTAPAAFPHPPSLRAGALPRKRGRGKQSIKRHIQTFRDVGAEARGNGDAAAELLP